MSVHSSAANDTPSLDKEPLQSEYSFLIEDDLGCEYTLRVVWQPRHEVYKLEFPSGYPMRSLYDGIACDINKHRLNRVFTKMILQIPKTVHNVNATHLEDIKDKTRLWLVANDKQIQDALSSGLLKVRHKAVDIDYATKNYSTKIELRVRKTND